MAPPVKFGLQLWPQQTTWPEVRDASLAAEVAGWDSIWTWDHLLAIQGPWEQPIFEGWALIHAVASVTSRVRVGLLVGANTFRNPGITAKLATTLDHVSNGRAVLGIGGAWFEREHEAFGIEFGASIGERLDRLEEAVPLMRRLFDGELVTHEGRFYTMVDALCAPRPSRRTCQSSSAGAVRGRRCVQLRGMPTGGTQVASRPRRRVSAWTSFERTATKPAATSRESSLPSASR